MNELQLVYRERTFVANLADVGISAAASDAEVRDAAERYFDLGRGALNNHQVTRPGAARILISEKAVFGR
jgi:hypothetical protein